MADGLRVRTQRRALKVARRLLVPPRPVDLELESRIEVGRHTYPARPPKVLSLGDHAARLVIGSFCSIADDVEFLLEADHRIDWVTTFPLRVMWRLPGANTDGHPATRGDIRIGHDVWIGSTATVLSGVSIGDGAVVGARAVVSRDVPPYAIVVGNPAKIARFRFPDDVIQALLRIRWWEWPDALIEERVDDLCGSSIDAFVAKYDL